MGTSETDRKPFEDVERVSIDAARDTLGDLVARADYAGTPAIITRYGKDAAVLVGFGEWMRRCALDTAAA